jgi:H+/gluconate symporter-like permease
MLPSTTKCSGKAPSGGMDTLPHNGAVITLLAVTGLIHREAYKDIFVITMIKSAAVFFVIGVYYVTGIY